VKSGGLVYHVLNRTVPGLALLRKQADYHAFRRMMVDCGRGVKGTSRGKAF